MTTRRFCARILLLSGAMLAMTGCGGSSGGDPATGVVVTPAPGSTTSPTPTASSTPTTTPTPTATAAAIGQANVGDTLRGPLACGQAGTLQFNTGTSSLARIANLTSIFIANELTLTYRAADTFALAVGGVAFATNPSPSIKRATTTGVYDYFREGFVEFEIYRNGTANRLANATIGRVSDQSRVCFFGLGGPADYARPGVSTQTFTGFADGVAIDASTNYRLFASATTARVDYTAARIELRMDLRGRESAFGYFTDVPFAGGSVATGTATLGSNGVFEGNVSTADGYTGSVRGQLHGGAPNGMTIAFTLRKSGSELAFGAAGLDPS